MSRETGTGYTRVRPVNDQRQQSFANSSYGPDNALHSSFSREGIDIGPRPDFWADFDAMQKRLPIASAGPAPQQAQALRDGLPHAYETPRVRKGQYVTVPGMTTNFGMPITRSHQVWMNAEGKLDPDPMGDGTYAGAAIGTSEGSARASQAQGNMNNEDTTKRWAAQDDQWFPGMAEARQRRERQG